MYVFSNHTTAPFCALYQTVFRYTIHLHITEQNNSCNYEQSVIISYKGDALYTMQL